MAVVSFAARKASVGLCDSLPLGMAQLSPHGLSEQWILRFCGDRLWALIARALGQPEAVFHATDGRPVYAAFCATALHIQPSGALLGRNVQISSSLCSISATRTGSRHRLEVGGAVIAELSMISTFVSHDASGCNNRIQRTSVLGDMRLPPAKSGLTMLDQQARDTAKRLRGIRVARTPEIYSERPVPVLDFNAAGLLYFPTFSRIAEASAHARAERPAPVVRREVVYLGNINFGDTVHVFDRDARTVLTRRDGAPIAVIRTLREDT